MMRVTPLMLTRQFTYLINNNATAQAQNLERLGTGKRINRPSDDPVGTVQSMQLQNAITSLSGDQRRAGQALSALQNVDGAINNSVNLLQQARTLILQAANGSLTDQDRAGIAVQMDSLSKQLLQTANARFGDHYVFSGTATTTQPFAAGAGGAVSYQGNGNQAVITLTDGTTLPTTLAGDSVFGGANDLFATLKDAAAAMRSGDTNSLSTGIVSRLDAGMQQVVDAQAEIGAEINRTQNIRTSLAAQSVTAQTNLSSVLDADIANETLSSQMLQNSQKAILASAARIMPMSLVDYMA